MIRHALLPYVVEESCEKKKERLRSGLTWISVKVKRPPNPTPTLRK